MTPRFDFDDLGIGVGLRTVHYDHILAEQPDVDWFEVLSDNYMHTRGRPLDFLDRISDRYPVALHGVGLSIGSTDPLNPDYLRQLRNLGRRCRAHWISDHIAWTGVSGFNGHDLYPVPYTHEALDHMVRRVRQVQDFLEAPLVLENPSTYASFKSASLDEATFIRELVEHADAGLLLDVNNVYVNSRNHGFDPFAYLRELPLDRVVQFHVAGHTVVDAPLGTTGPETHLIDTHSATVSDPVWELLAEAFRLGARAPVLLEWDADIPSFPEVLAEAEKARVIRDANRVDEPVPESQRRLRADSATVEVASWA